ncbi:MAG: hypothetical protein JWM47_410 [Acidimicrobiales bacterium]|nr:hypothetical protein [Acidimicrobiales bacterium]
MNALLERVAADGYCTVPLLDADQVTEIRAYFDGLEVDPETPRFVSAVHLERERAIAVDRWLSEKIGPPLERLLGSDLEPFLSAFFAKGARHGDRMTYHQDWSYTDERHHRSVLTWIPLVDVGPGNGAMYVVPGSHRWSDGIRPSNIDAAPPTDPHLDAFEERAVLVEMRAGEALVYDPAIVHGTPPNTTDDTRPVAGLALVPRDAELVHYQADDDGTVAGLRVPRGTFYMDAFTRQLDPEEPVEVWAAPVAPGDFDDHLAPPELTPQPPVASDPAGRRLWRRLRR